MQSSPNGELHTLVRAESSIHPGKNILYDKIIGKI